METNDPALTKTPISSHDTLAEMVEHTHEKNHHDKTTTDHNGNDKIVDTEVKGTQTLQETVVGTSYIEDGEDETPVDAELAEREVLANRTSSHTYDNHDNHEKIEENTQVNKGTDTFEEDIVETKHVYDDDNPARQPDRRDQQGSTAFDEGVNDETMGSEAPQSEELNDMNRYASIDNAQTRILNPDEKD